MSNINKKTITKSEEMPKVMDADPRLLESIKQLIETNDDLRLRIDEIRKCINCDAKDIDLYKIILSLISSEDWRADNERQILSRTNRLVWTAMQIKKQLKENKIIKE